MRLIIFGGRRSSDIKTQIVPAQSAGDPLTAPFALEVKLVDADGPIKYGLLQSLTNARLYEAGGLGSSVAWQDLALIVEFEYRGLNTGTGEHRYRVRVDREGYSLPNGEGGYYWTPRIRDILGIRWVHDNEILVDSDRPAVRIDWQVPQASIWSAANRLAGGKIRWIWDAEK